MPPEVNHGGEKDLGYNLRVPRGRGNLWCDLRLRAGKGYPLSDLRQPIDDGLPFMCPEVTHGLGVTFRLT